MNKNEAKQIISSTFSNDFDEQRYKKFASNLLKQYVTVDKIVEGSYIKQAYAPFVIKYKIIGTFEDSEGYKIDILEVYLSKVSTLERARTAQRNFVAEYLKSRGDAALVAFISPDNKEWRLSLVKLEHSLEVVDKKLKTKEQITPAKRWSFLVGQNEGSHTAQSRFVNMLISDENPNLAELESAFDIETVTDEFFKKYTELYFRVREHLDKLLEKDEIIKKDFEEKEISTVDFAKKTLGQIVFLYFLQKKGWFGVAPDKKWGEGPKKFLRELFKARDKYGNNFFNDILEPLFYKALAQDRGRESIYPELNNCRMPFLNGGLFEPMLNYSWETTDIVIPDELFSNEKIDSKTKDKATGILDVFDRYNFTVNENEPLEKEVAVDPEMLGKVFENLLDIKDRKSKGAFYTPREIVHYMCQESLINYLETETKNKIPHEDLELFIQKGDRIIENDKITLERKEEREKKYGVGKYKDTTYSLLLPESVRAKVNKLDELLANIKVADPAVGSGAFPLGMINEIVRARKVLNVYLKKDISDYDFKKHAITHSIYGVDKDPGAVDIAKLRLWLALVVDEETPHPLPNLEHKIMQGNSLISEYEGIKLFDESIFDSEKKEMKQAKLGLGKTSSEIKMEALQDKISIYIDEAQKTKKQNLKSEIDNLKWELIEETLKEQGKENMLEEVKKLRHKNIRPFFIWKLEFSDVFKEKGGFDVVIGNPPYVGEKGNKDIFRQISKGNLGRYYQGKMDLFYFFFHIALDLGKKGSQNAFITTNYYITALGARKLRIDLKERAIIRNLINFNELRIFESARGQHNMITIFSKGQGQNIKAKTCVTKRTGTANEEILNAIVSGKDKETQYYEVEQKKLYDGEENNIRLGGVGNLDNPIEMILEKMKKQGESLGGKEGICNVNQGIVTGADKVSNKHLKQYNWNSNNGDGIYVLSDEEIQTFPQKKYINKWFKNSNITRYSTKLHSKENILYIDDNFDKDSIVIEHLKKFKENLEFRREVYKGARNWFELWRSREQKIFESPKIVAPQRSKTNTFGYNEIPWYASADVYFITVKENSEIELKYILALLNSKLYYQWLYHRGKRKGEMLELYQKPLSEIPIKKIEPEAQKPFIDLVDQILEITSQENYDPKNPPIQQKELEKQIDELVYKLYDLTDKEIKIVGGK